MHQCLVGTPTGTAKTNTNDTIIVTAKATDEDANTTLTYTLWWGSSSGNLSATNITKTGTSGQAVTLEKSDLSNDTTYYFKVVVSDGVDSDTSGQSSAKTYCLATHCGGGTYTYPNCTSCGGTGKIQCSNCRGNGSVTSSTTCSTCYGQGQKYEACKGKVSYVTSHRRVKVMRGVRDKLMDLVLSCV